jgi:hypothetical protein
LFGYSTTDSNESLVKGLIITTNRDAEEDRMHNEEEKINQSSSWSKVANKREHNEEEKIN